MVASENSETASRLGWVRVPQSISSTLAVGTVMVAICTHVSRKHSEAECLVHVDGVVGTSPTE